MQQVPRQVLTNERHCSSSPVCHLRLVCLQLQRAVAVKRAIQDVLDRSPRLQALTPPKTREVVQWCRQRGYTLPDLEPQHKNDDESIEDILTQIDNEPGESCAQTLRRCSLVFLSNPEWISFSPPCVGEVLQLLSPEECEGGQCAASGFFKTTYFVHFLGGADICKYVFFVCFQLMMDKVAHPLWIRQYCLLFFFFCSFWLCSGAIT